MEKETQYEISLRLAQKWMDETSDEEKRAAFKKIDDMKIEGPTLDEYLVILQNELERALK